MRAVKATAVLALMSAGLLLIPAHAGVTDSSYVRLERALATYRVIESHAGWPAVRTGVVMRYGDDGEPVRALRGRLAVTDRLAPAASDQETVFDTAVDAAVRRFQERHGLEVDGVVGRRTIAAMNVPVGSRIRQMELNLDRLRADSLGSRYVQVNIPAFSLKVIEGGRSLLEMKVIVGKASTPTPLFSTRITGVVLAPYWVVPSSIARGEILPRAKRDPGYLKRNHIRVLPDGTLRQDPGPTNSLGSVKFSIPNRFGVGLHDTPERYLFEYASCAFSHGCMRAEHPVELAEYLLWGTDWTREVIDSTIAKWEETRIDLADAVPLHVTYLTAWADESGIVNFRDDIYGYDRRTAT